MTRADYTREFPDLTFAYADPYYDTRPIEAWAITSLADFDDPLDDLAFFDDLDMQEIAR